MVKGRGRTKPSGVVSVVARPPGLSLQSTSSHDGPASWCRRLAAPKPVGPAPMMRMSIVL